MNNIIKNFEFFCARVIAITLLSDRENEEVSAAPVLCDLIDMAVQVCPGANAVR